VCARVCGVARALRRASTAQPVSKTGSGAVDEERRRRDLVSHFVLRLAYCRTEELRRWLLTQECALFKYRFSKLGPTDKVAFLAYAGLEYKPTSPHEFAAVKDAILTVLQVTNGKNAKDLIQEGAASFYAVPFQHVPDLVRGRRVYLRGGMAFLHREALTSLVVGAYRTSLSRALAVTQRKWAATFASEEAERVAPIVESLSTRYLGQDYGGARSDGGAGVSLQELDAAAAQSFPLCMRNLYGHLKDAHHLRHQGRMQLGLFLKGLGLNLEDALQFWRTEFCRKIPGDQFEKQYAYGIRHNYGREGKRADYTPFSCMKVIMSTPGTGEHHGCPYRSFSEESLRAALRGMRLSSAAVSDVLDKVKGKHYQLACGVAFAATHNGCECESGVQHPNGYADASRKLLAKPAAAQAALPAPAAAPGVDAGQAVPPGLVTPAVAVKSSILALGDVTPPSARGGGAAP